MKKRLNSLSGGLAEIRTDGDEQRVQLIHQSVNDYILKEGLQLLDGSFDPTSTLIGRAHARLSRSCIKYMVMNEITMEIFDLKKAEGFEPLPSPYGTGLIESGKVFCLRFHWLYAVDSWLLYAKVVESNKIPQDDLLVFLDWPSTEALQHLMAIRDLSNPHSRLLISGQTLLHLASFHGLTSVVMAILKKLSPTDLSPDSKDCYGQKPLCLAAERGHHVILELLLMRHGVNPDSRDFLEQTPLLKAAEGGHEPVSKLLLECANVNVNAKDWYSNTPLSIAARKGHKKLVELFIGRDDVEVNSKDLGGMTPLSFSAREGHATVVQLLLTDPNIEVNNGHAELLFNPPNIKADCKNGSGRTPLSLAAEAGRLTVVQILFKHP